MIKYWNCFSHDKELKAEYASEVNIFKAVKTAAE